MPGTLPNAMDFAGRRLRLATLVRLRWLAIGGQTVTIAFVDQLLGFSAPVPLCLSLVALSALVNLFLRLRYPASLRLEQWPAFGLLAFDAVQLAGLLYVTGGLDNPFAILLLVPVIISATTLPPRPTTLLGLLVVSAATFLAVMHWPLPWPAEDALQMPLLYTVGVWVALVSACVFTGVYAFRVAEEGRQLARALSAAELVLAREHHLAALDGLAAAAAHELATPLATIALVAKELERETLPGSPHAEDVALLRSQSQRCRDILARLTSLSEQGDQHFARLPLSHLVEEVVEPYRAFAAKIVVLPPKGEGAEPVGARNPAIVQGLVNLVENAVDFAITQVTVASEWTGGTVAITITDDGPGFAAGIIDRIGEPYVTTRVPGDNEAGGLGLGLFIAKTLLERSGARLHLANRRPPAHGATVRAVWPRPLMDMDAADAGRFAETNAGGAAWRRALESL